MHILSFHQRCFLALLSSLTVVPAADAIVLALTANVTAEVQELSGGSVLNSDQAFDELDVTTRNLPLIAEAFLLPPASLLDPEEISVAGAVTTTFRDPRLNTAGPPNEFAIEAVGFSNSAGSSVSGRSLAVEMREIVFQAEEVGLSAGTAVIARSHFFLDGVLVLLAKPNQLGLTGARTELTLRVFQERSGAQPSQVLEASVVLTGNADGTASLEVNGGLAAENLSTFGLNALTPAQGSFQAVALPELAIPYTYPADIGETFDLRAEIQARFDAPPGAGAAVVLGERLNALIEVLAETLGADVAAAYEAGLNAGLNGVSIPLVPLVAAEQDTVLQVVTDADRLVPFLEGGRCGLLGMESAMMVVGLAVLGLVSRKRM